MDKIKELEDIQEGLGLLYQILLNQKERAKTEIESHDLDRGAVIIKNIHNIIDRERKSIKDDVISGLG